MILVSGGTGLVGSHLLVELLKKHPSVCATYRTEESKEKAREVFDFHQAGDLFNKIRWVQADVTDYFKLKDCFQGITHVYHCAAFVSFDERKRTQILEVNVEGTKNIVNLCLEYNIEKLCYVSSVAAIGGFTNKNFIDEQVEWQYGKSTSAYSLSKFHSENEVWRGIAEGLNGVIINPSTILGYGNWDLSSLIILKRVAKGLSFYPPGVNGFVGVDDVVSSAILLMESSISGQRYIISAENMSFKSLFELIAKAFKKKAPSKKVNKNIVTLLLFIDWLHASLFGLKRKLPASSLNTIFQKRYFSADKFVDQFNYQFKPIDQVIQEVAPAFLAKNNKE